VTAGHRGRSYKERLNKGIFGPHLTCVKSSRPNTIRDNNGTQNFKSFIWGTDYSGVQWEIPAEVWPTLGV